MKALTKEEALEWFESNKKGLYLNAYELIKFYGPEVLRGLKEGELIAYKDYETGLPLVSKEAFMEWMTEPGQFEKVKEWVERNENGGAASDNGATIYH